MALTEQEQALLDELTRRASAPDESDFEIEIFSGDKGARIPLSHGKQWLADNFGIDAEQAEGDGAAEGDGGGAGKKTAAKPGAKPGAEPARTSYFAKKAAGTQGTH
jgi:hypothetical protein